MILMAKAKKQRKKTRGNSIPVLITLLLLLVGTYVFIFFLQNSNSRIAEVEAQKSLQLGTFQPTNKPVTTRAPIKNLATPTPTPNQKFQCTHDTGKKIINPECSCVAWIIKCENLKCVEVISQANDQSQFSCNDANDGSWCAPPFANEGDGTYCIGKPIIYLYPETPTFVDVFIETVGTVFVSKPQIEQLGGLALIENSQSKEGLALSEKREGWQNVLAYPNGNLSYQGNQYRELFYETDVEDFEKPTNGISISKENIEPELKQILTKLGLNTFEANEFLEFWVPILKNQDKPYIQFSLIQGAAKDEIDKVIINPKPETFIEILAYFKPLDTPFQGSTLILPSHPPKRIGFTAVEWGGVLDEN